MEKVYLALNKGKFYSLRLGELKEPKFLSPTIQEYLVVVGDSEIKLNKDYIFDKEEDCCKFIDIMNQTTI